MLKLEDMLKTRCSIRRYGGGIVGAIVDQRPGGNDLSCLQQRNWLVLFLRDLLFCWFKYDAAQNSFRTVVVVGGLLERKKKERFKPARGAMARWFAGRRRMQKDTPPVDRWVFLNTGPLKGRGILVQGWELVLEGV